MSNSSYNAPTWQGNPASAIPVYSAPYTGGSLGYMQEAVGASAVSLSPPAGARYAVIVPSVAVVYRDDGTAPTTSVGMPAAANVPFTYAGNLAAIEFIAQSTAGNLNITYYG